MKAIFYTILSIVILSSCANEVEIPTIIKMDYYLRVDQTAPIVRTDAVFMKEGDTTPVELLQVKFEDKLMKGIKRENNMMQYSYNDKADQKDSYRLSFQTLDEVQHNFDFKITPIKDFYIKEGKISKSKGFTLLWDGADIQKNETLVILITDSNNGSLAMNWIAEAAASKGIFVRPEQIGTYKTGAGQIYLTRKTTQQIPQTNNVEGNANIEYYTVSKTVEIVD